MAGVPMIPTAEASAPEATSATRLWYKSFANLAAGEVVASLLRLTAITWLARIGLQHFATIGAGLALGRYLTALSSSGLETIGTREAAARRKPQADLVGEVVTTRFVLAVPTFAIFATAIHVIPMDNLTRLALLGFGLMVFTSAADVRWFFVGIQRTRPIAIASVLSGALVAGGTILLVRTRADWTFAAPIYVSGDLVFALFLLVIMRRIVGRWPVGVTRDGFRHLVRASLPITLLRSVRTATISLDVVLARIMLPTAEASHYAVANHFALVGTVYLGLFYNTFLPSIMREAAQGADALRRLISVAIRRATRVGAGLALLATIIAPPFFSVLLGPKFHAT